MLFSSDPGPLSAPGIPLPGQPPFFGRLTQNKEIFYIDIRNSSSFHLPGVSTDSPVFSTCRPLISADILLCPLKAVDNPVEKVENSFDITGFSTNFMVTAHLRV